MTLLITVLVLISFMFVGLLVFLYMMGNPRPTEPGFIRRIRLHPSAIGEYTALFAHGLFHPHQHGGLSSRRGQDGLDRCGDDDL